MGKEYAKALTHLDIQDVTILTRTIQEPSVFSTKFKYKVYHDGFEKHLPTILILQIQLQIQISNTIFLKKFQNSPHYFYKMY